MRILVVILGFFGAFAGGLQGFKWRSDLNNAAGQMARAMEQFSGSSELASLDTASILLIMTALVGVVISTLIITKKGPTKVYGAVLIAAGILPLIGASSAVFALPMALGGLIALFLKDD